jgi:hypothetical protein
MKPRKFTDTVIVSNYMNMLELTEIYNKLHEMSKEMIPIHPETLINYHLAFKKNRHIKMHKDWIFEICRTDFACIENEMARYPDLISVQKLQKKATYAFDNTNTKNKHITKVQIKEFIKLVFYPLKKIIIYIKQFCRWITAE